MDRAISASEADKHFSELLRDVSEGQSFTVMSRGRPVDHDQERRSVDRLLKFVTRLPVRHSGDWSRHDLYE